MLTWVDHGAGLIAERNGHTVGIIAQRHADGLFAWEVTAVHTRWTGKGSGKTKTMSAAKAALSRSWNTWLTAYGLKEIA